MQRVFFLFFVLLFSSCGYQWGSKKNTDVVVMDIPYAKGDMDGAFTAAVIRQINHSFLFDYDPSSRRLILQLSLYESAEENIGYRHDRNDLNLPKKSVLPTEGRKKAKAEVVLVEESSGKVLFGPMIVEADVDYDFITQNSLNDLTFITPSGKRESLLNFSMGQLEPSSSAQEAARKVLLEKLSKKIVNLMSVEWKKINGRNCQ
jgi:hypothetical protein